MGAIRHKFSIKHKLFAIFLVISLLPIFLITVVSYRGYSDLIHRQVSATAANLLDSSMNKLGDALDEIAGVSQTFAYQPYSPDNRSIIDILRRHKAYTDDLNSFELLQSHRDLKFLFESLLYTHRYMNGIYLFAAGGNSFYYARTDNDLLLGYRPEGADWYKRTLEDGIYVSDIGRKDYSMSAKPSVSFSRLIVDPTTNEPLGVVLIDCNLELFGGIDKNILPQQSAMFITSLDGRIEYDSSEGKEGVPLSASGEELLSGKEAGQFMDDKGEWLTIFKTFPNYEWKLVLRVSMAALENQFVPVRNVLIAIAATCCIMFWAISFFLSRMVTRPIVNLSRIMKSEKSNEVLLNNKYLQGSDEIATLYNEYNAMIAENKAIIKERYQNRIIVLDSQMRALEAQINSHFLYNTLESINSIADVEGVVSITVITKALGDMFRYSIKTDSEQVRLRDELTHVLNYLTIQKMRYGDKLVFEIEIDEHLREEKILKLILQPLVENAIYHGLETKEGPGKITISGRMNDDSLEIDIRDDGSGMTEKQLEQLRRQLKVPPRFTEMGRRDKGGIGVSNIHSRIRLYYGEASQEAGIEVDSEPGRGTNVRVRVPRLKP
ncbi:sensor histidine kinase [Cohnella sp. LGH]|uniref:cache domain-containing sensor histidine kinase n=1 Tax=Cohnella sp. LGH TaxID=1619153 RepID=UPI001ADD0C77|nr:sensor histidine kinase [Cohnella sp. LGH]QTH41941.1 sensor histidine kinase [Cohnella sp. LGH]